jgi:hypothetical protein
MPQPNLVWLASYPKSGNTWFRAFLSALLHGSGNIDLNGLKTDGIFSSREIFDTVTDLDSRDLSDEEVKELLPDVYRSLSDELDNIAYLKVHDAYTFNRKGLPIVPPEATRCAIYIIRNPLDIVASFANHMGSTLDKAIALMNNDQGMLARQKNNLNTNSQLSQLVLSWSGHVQSWTGNLPFPVMVIRYEDMLAEPLKTFQAAVEFIGIKTTTAEINEAIKATSFTTLQQQEQEKGFKEKTAKAKQFFRSGSAGNWKHELTSQQAASVIEHHTAMMQRYNYDTEITTS